MSGAYYNENHPHAAQWLRNLIAAGHIAPGDVDERDIRLVHPVDLIGYRQCHFFAGIGVWSYALRLAGWPDDREVWTGSCPCQPFSAAGKKQGFADERHLWPAWHDLLKQRPPSVVFGEQVADKGGFVWLDLVQADLEALAYAVGPVVLPAAGFGSPNGRHRIFFVADADRERFQGWTEQDFGKIESAQQASRRGDAVRRGAAGTVDYAADARHDDSREHDGGSPLLAARPLESSLAGSLGHSEGIGWVWGKDNEHEGRGQRASGQAGPVNGFWHGAEWLACTDGVSRPVEPGTFPLVDGAPARVGRLRAYGNAINAEVARHFIEAYLDVRRNS